MSVPFRRVSPTFTGYWGFKVENFESCIQQTQSPSPVTYVPATAVWKGDKCDMPKAGVSASKEIIRIECEKD